MSGQARMRITIAPDGSVTVGVEGVTGPSCSRFGGDLAEALGTTLSVSKTSDYYAQPVQQEQKRKVVV